MLPSGLGTWSYSVICARYARTMSVTTLTMATVLASSLWRATISRTPVRKERKPAFFETTQVKPKVAFLALSFSTRTMNMRKKWSNITCRLKVPRMSEPRRPETRLRTEL